MTSPPSDPRTKRLAANLAAVHERVRAAGGPRQPRLVAVTKTVTPEVALALARAGALDLGENRVDELERKHAAFSRADAPPAVRWHFIGHLQRNKARRVVRLVDAIHSVDGFALLDTLAGIAAEEQRRPDVYLQVKLTDEPTKHGFAPAELEEAVQRAGDHASLRLVGLMTMAPLVEDPDAARRAADETFGELARLADSLPQEAFAEGRPLLSMGMSGDLEQAVRAGSDWLRIGSALFEGVEGRTPPSGVGGPAR